MAECVPCSTVINTTSYLFLSHRGFFIEHAQITLGDKNKLCEISICKFKVG